MKGFRRQKKAFTLIELIVVIAIIAILSAIATVSALAILRSNEKKSAQTTLTNDWKLTSQAFDQINLGYTTVKRPTTAFLASRLGLSTSSITLTTSECTSLSKGRVHIQYIENPENLRTRYQIKRITINYNGNYYFTENGKDVRGPRDSLS